MIWNFISSSWKEIIVLVVVVHIFFILIKRLWTFCSCSGLTSSWALSSSKPRTASSTGNWGWSYFICSVNILSCSRSGSGRIFTFRTLSWSCSKTWATSCICVLTGSLPEAWGTSLSCAKWGWVSKTCATPYIWALGSGFSKTGAVPKTWTISETRAISEAWAISKAWTVPKTRAISEIWAWLSSRLSSWR